MEWHTTSYVEDSLNASFPNGSKHLLSYIKVEVKIILELGHFIVMVEHIHIDSLDRVNVLNHHFSSVFTTEEDASLLPTVHDHNIPTMHLITISSMDVASLLKPFRASGPDDIPAYLLNKVATQIRPSPNNYRPISLFCLCCKILEHNLF